MRSRHAPDAVDWVPQRCLAGTRCRPPYRGEAGSIKRQVDGRSPMLRSLTCRCDKTSSSEVVGSDTVKIDLARAGSAVKVRLSQLCA